MKHSRTNVLGVGVSSINMDEAVTMLMEARMRGQTGYVCVTGVHGVIESQRDPVLRQIHNRSFLTVPDGMPTVWMGREQGFVHMGRVYGPDLMLSLCEATAQEVGSTGGRQHAAGNDAPREKTATHAMENDVPSNYLYPSQEETGVLDVQDIPAIEQDHPAALSGRPDPASRPQPSSFGTLSAGNRVLTHFLYGSTPEVLAKLKTNLENRFPGIRIVGTYSPPFRMLNEEEEDELQQLVSGCRPDFFWVGLSTPKQERFMASHAPPMKNPPQESDRSRQERSGGDSIPSSLHRAETGHYTLDCGIMLGVGAAFDIHAGLLKDAPDWVKNSGLQWVYRLCQEPRRLWRRYLDIVPKFLWLAALQLLGVKKYSLDDEELSSP